MAPINPIILAILDSATIIICVITTTYVIRLFFQNRIVWKTQMELTKKAFEINEVLEKSAKRLDALEKNKEWVDLRDCDQEVLKQVERIALWHDATDKEIIQLKKEFQKQIDDLKINKSNGKKSGRKR